MRQITMVLSCRALYDVVHPTMHLIVIMKTTVSRVRRLSETAFEARISHPGWFAVGDLFWYESEERLLELSRKNEDVAMFRVPAPSSSPIETLPENGSQLVLDLQACSHFAKESWSDRFEFEAPAPERRLARRVVNKPVPGESPA